MDVKSLIFEVRLTKKRPFILSIAIHGFWIPAIPAGMTLFKICVDTHALERTFNGYLVFLLLIRINNISQRFHCHNLIASHTALIRNCLIASPIAAPCNSPNMTDLVSTALAALASKVRNSVCR